jgi:tetraacyldisaccharide 4'-kinase
LNLFLKILLLPFAAFYASVIWIRNTLYKSHFIGSTNFEIPVIAVGNLSVGGTGKTPFVEMLIELLHGKYSSGVLSRGYKRKTSGYLEVQRSHTANDAGDEPLMIKLKYPDTAVSVGEQRVIAIPSLLANHPQLQVILLDDAFQHQSVRPDINILLTTYGQPYWRDRILPLGMLREFRSGSERANIIVVTKCPEDLPESGMQSMLQEMRPKPKQKVFFASVAYGQPYNLLDAYDRLYFDAAAAQLLVTGIASPDTLKKYIESNSKEVVHFNFDDHHFFEMDELASIKKNYPQFRHWITTEKDGVRLALHRDWLMANDIAVYCVSIRTKLIGANRNEFAPLITGFLDYFYKDESAKGGSHE